MARRTILALAVLLPAATSPGAQEAGIFSQGPKDKLPVPSETTQKEALRLVGEVYKADYDAAKTPEAKQALARKLLQAAAEAHQPANRYVLLDVARDVAAKAADVDVAFEAADAMAAAYQVDAFGLKLEALETALRAGSSPAQLKGVVEGALALLGQAAARDDFETTTRLGRMTLAAARRTRDLKLVNRVITRNREIERAAQAYRKVKIALATLEKSPGDPKANQTVGHYLCLVKGDWEKGLSMLALGSDEALKALAVQELQGVSDPAAQATLGDGWWDLAQTEQGAAKARLQQRARLWYAKALPNLTGLVKTKVQQRLEEAEPAAAKPAKKPAHYLAPENVKNVAFLTYARDSWKNDGSHLFDVRAVEGGYEVTCRADSASKWKMILFPNENVFAKRLIASFSVEQGECLLSLRPKDLSARGSSVTFSRGEKHRVQFWIQNGVAQMLVDNRPTAIPHNDRTNYGFFGFVPAAGTRIVFYELRFAGRE